MANAILNFHFDFLKPSLTVKDGLIYDSPIDYIHIREKDIFRNVSTNIDDAVEGSLCDLFYIFENAPLSRQALKKPTSLRSLV